MTEPNRAASVPAVGSGPREVEGEAPASPVQPGDIVGGRYVVGAVIGEGGMGVVCEATHMTLVVPVAIKLIRPAFKHDSEFVQRFLNEARRAALLKGEHVARVHDVGQLESGEPYLVMERLEGIVLDAYLQRAGPLLPEDAIALALQVCDGLAEAHAQGIVHRDIKPGNLFLVHLPNGRINVKILDFGISKQLEDDAPSTLTNRDKSLGSPWYMSPEQMMDSSSVDHRSDIWSLGVVLYELLTNRRPFDGATVPEVCAKVLTGGTPPLEGAQVSIDPALEAIVFRCLAKEPVDRFPDVLALADALQAFVTAHRERKSLGSWGPVGELVSAAHVRERAPGSIAPLATTRRSGPGPVPGERRPHWLGIAGMAATLAVGVAGITKVVAEEENVSLPWFAGGALTELSPGPEPVPLDRGNEPLYLAVPGPATPAPEVVPMPQALSTVPIETEAAAEMPSAAERAAQLRAWQRRPRPDGDDNPYAERSGRHRSAVELGDTLGRLRDEYTRSFALAPDPDPPVEPEPEPEPESNAASDESRREPEPKRAEPAPKAEPTPATEARDRYGL